MEKRIWWTVSVLVILVMLTACGGKESVSPNKEENKAKTEQQKNKKKDYVEIASNENMPLEKKKIKVVLPKILSDPRISKDDLKLAQAGIDEYNNTRQKLPKNSIGILSYDSYYDVESRELVIAAVLINNRIKTISDIEFEGNMHITIDSKARVMPGSFRLEAKNYGSIQPGEGTIVPLSFRVLNYTKDTITFSKKEIEGSFYNFKFKELDK
ncbi:hypothetical protein [Listeria grayi]|uniref:hypothetical protein n=1 Tax=Listeria grayi TaxID=1641 RepID=UPI0021AB367A|nr:hypothetical protein [Listeria grayi]